VGERGKSACHLQNRPPNKENIGNMRRRASKMQKNGKIKTVVKYPG